MAFSKQKRARLVELLGEARVQELEAGTLDMKAAAEAAGVEFKDVEEPSALDRLLSPVGPFGSDSTKAATKADPAEPALERFLGHPTRE